MQFTEYVEDLEMAIQLPRLWLFNPKLLWQTWECKQPKYFKH